MLPDLLGDCEYTTQHLFEAAGILIDIYVYFGPFFSTRQYFFLSLHVGNCNIGRRFAMKSYACLFRIRVLPGKL